MHVWWRKPTWPLVAADCSSKRSLCFPRVIGQQCKRESPTFFSNLAVLLLLLPRLSVRYISCAKSIKTLRAQLLMAFFPLCSLPPLTMHRACKGGQGRLSFSLCFTGSRKYVGQRSVQPWGRGTTYGQGSRECPANLEKGNFFCSFEEKRGFKA